MTRSSDYRNNKMHKEFLTLSNIKDVLGLSSLFKPGKTEKTSLEKCLARVTASDIFSDENIPPFDKSTVDGFAVTSSSTFGSSENNPSCLVYIKESVRTGRVPEFSIKHGEAAKIQTGGMIPERSDAVVMLEHAEIIGSDMLEVFRPAAPGSNIIYKGDDIKAGDLAIPGGTRLRAQEVGILAAIGQTEIEVVKKPVVGIISTGDEIVPASCTPEPGEIRDVNAHTLWNMTIKNGGIPVFMGLVRDDYDQILEACENGLTQCDILLISGGSSVGTRDYTLDIIKKLTMDNILVQGVSMSPGKPVILGKSENRQIWGIPGHVASAMIVFHTLVRPFLNRLEGLAKDESIKIPATLTKNVASANGRTDFIRVRLIYERDRVLAEPVIGKSGLLFTIIKSDGIIEINRNCEGLKQGSQVFVTLLGH